MGEVVDVGVNIFDELRLIWPERRIDLDIKLDSAVSQPIKLPPRNPLRSFRLAQLLAAPAHGEHDS